MAFHCVESNKTQKAKSPLPLPPPRDKNNDQRLAEARQGLKEGISVLLSDSSEGIHRFPPNMALERYTLLGE